MVVTPMAIENSHMEPSKMGLSPVQRLLSSSRIVKPQNCGVQRQEFPDVAIKSLGFSKKNYEGSELGHMRISPAKQVHFTPVAKDLRHCRSTGNFIEPSGNKTWRSVINVWPQITANGQLDHVGSPYPIIITVQ